MYFWYFTEKDEGMLRVLEERLNTINGKVAHQDLNEEDVPQMKNWIINLIKTDFRVREFHIIQKLNVILVFSFSDFIWLPGVLKFFFSVYF